MEPVDLSLVAAVINQLLVEALQPGEGVTGTVGALPKDRAATSMRAISLSRS
jgi:hypothetical protein